MSPLTVLDPAVRLAYHAVTAVAAALPWPAGAAALPLAPVLVTAATRAALLPLSVAAARGERARAGLAPELARLRARFAHDPARLRGEQLAAHRRAGVRPGQQSVTRAARLARVQPGGTGGSSAASLPARLLPFGSVVAAVLMPPAVGLYLVTATAWTLAERAVLARQGG